MADILRYITLDVGGRPVVALDLNDTANFQVVVESFSVEPASKQAIMSSADRRYGGSRQVGETTDNGAVSWKALVTGASYDGCLALVESMLSQMEANPLPLMLEWRPDGTSQSSLYDIRGTAAIKNSYLYKQFVGTQSWVFELSVPVAPLARGLPMDILDLFAVDTRGDYTYDSGASTNEEVAAGELKCAANPSTEQVAIHTARGYQYGDNQQTVKCVPGATISGCKAGVALKRTGVTTRLEVYVEDEGTNSRLRIDKVVAGVRTNLNTTTLPARIKTATAFWVRGRIEGNVVNAEYFTAVPTPMGTFAWNLNTTLAGGDIAAFGSAVKGSPGRVWIPKTVGASIAEYSVEPYTYRNLILPQAITLAGAIPGDAMALADVTLTTSGGAAPPIFALLGWSRKPAAGLAQAPFGLIEAEAAGNLSGWAVKGSLADFRGGSGLIDTAAAATDAYTASWPVDPSLMARDSFTTEVAIEVWLRIYLSPTIVTPAFTISARPQDGLSYGSARYTDEWGAAGKLVTVPTAAVMRFVRLGTLRMLVDPVHPRIWLLWLAASIGAGSSGEIGVDYLALDPANGRACSPCSRSTPSSPPRSARPRSR